MTLRIHFICDECETDLDTEEDSFELARGALKDARWWTDRKGGAWVHYCAECRPTTFERR